MFFRLSKLKRPQVPQRQCRRAVTACRTIRLSSSPTLWLARTGFGDYIVEEVAAPRQQTCAT